MPAYVQKPSQPGSHQGRTPSLSPTATTFDLELRRALDECTLVRVVEPVWAMSFVGCVWQLERLDDRQPRHTSLAAVKRIA